MDKYTAQEQAFKRGYEKGYEAGIAKEKKAYCDGLLDGRRAALECVPLAKWIPVSERLPDEDGTYIVRTTSGAVTTARFYKEMTFPPTAYRNEEYVRKASFQSNRHVTHWMPLPEPPKGE